MNERRDKKWNETKTNDSWSIFKIMGEFVEGFEKMGLEYWMTQGKIR